MADKKKLRGRAPRKKRKAEQGPGTTWRQRGEVPQSYKQHQGIEREATLPAAVAVRREVIGR